MDSYFYNYSMSNYIIVRNNIVIKISYNLNKFIIFTIYLNEKNKHDFHTIKISCYLNLTTTSIYFVVFDLIYVLRRDLARIRK